MFQSFLHPAPAQAGVQSPRIPLSSLALAGVVLCLSAPAVAQVSASTPDDCTVEPNNCIVIADLRVAPDILVAARVPQYESEVAQAVTVYRRADIERRQTVVLTDLLATTPGVGVTRNGSTGGFTAVRLRGAEGEQTLTVIDGIRVNDPSSPGGGFDFANLLSASVERVEVLRGPDSVPWGSQAIGGVVNIVTADPTRLASGDVAARAQAEGGYAGQFYSTAGVQGRTGIVSGALSGGYLRTNGISSAANGSERDGYRQYGASGRVGVALSDAVAIDLRGYWADSRAELDGFPAPAFSLADDREYSTAQELYGYAGLRARLGRLDNRVAFTIADIDRDNFDRDAGNAPIFLGRGRSERYEYQGDWRPLDAVRVTGGVERENSRFNDGTTFVRTGVTSVYGELILQPVRAVTLSGGVRHDDHDAFGGHTTLGGNAAWRRGETTLRASYGEGFKAPTLFQLYAPFFGTATLRPETAHSFDLGVEQRLLDGAITARATYFHRRTRDQIDFDLATFTYANIARTRAEGIEGELTLRPSEALTLTASYTYLRTENRSSGANLGHDLARRPRDTASVDADYRFPFGLSVGGTVLLVGDSFDDPSNSVRLDGYALVGVRAELPIGERLSLYGRIENAGDARYQTVAGYGSYGRAAYGGVRVRLD